MNPERFLARLREADGYEGQVSAERTLPAREPVYAEPVRPLPSKLAGLRLYAHQAHAVDRLREGSHTIVATGTASGKSLCYQAPIAEALLSDRDATAIYICPTKALAQDQLRQVARLDLREVRAEVYDGDTPQSLRAGIRRHANLLLTNPDMLHVGILPHHELWAAFLRGLRFVVVDEAHWMRGVFGSHVAMILRRLRRLAKGYRSEPTFALASATISNPSAHASALTGLDVGAVTEDGAPCGPRHVAFWNPPPLAGTEGRRASSNYETASLLTELVRDGARTLVFSKSRVAAELVARYSRQRLGFGAEERIAAYRAGYLASERRELEDGLASGALAGVSATNALELGIDVGGLDAVVLNGFPGTVASAWQQAGRAGRTGQPSLAIVVAQDEPLDQFYATHPEEFFGRPHEAALVNPSNPVVIGPHLGCAAYERPLSASDAEWFGESWAPVASAMVAAGELRERRGRMYWAERRAPANDVDIRSAGGSPYRVVESGTGRLIGTVDEARAFLAVHPGAVYMHQGETFRVRELVLADRVAVVEPFDAPEYTHARHDTDVVILATEATGWLAGEVELRCGVVEVTEQVVAYQRRKLPGGELLGVQNLVMPPQTLRTRAVWYTAPDDLVERALAGHGGDADTLLGSLHAAEHAAIGILPAFAMCDRWDIGGLSTNWHPDTGRPSIFIYDGYPMGAGIAEHAFTVAADHLRATRRHVASCRCEDGCPACVQSPKCGNWNRPLHKAGAVSVLDMLLGSSGARSAEESSE